MSDGLTWYYDRMKDMPEKHGYVFDENGNISSSYKQESSYDDPTCGRLCGFYSSEANAKKAFKVYIKDEISVLKADIKVLEKKLSKVSKRYKNGNYNKK